MLRETRIVLFTDVEGSTSVRTTRGDEAGDEMIALHDAVVGQAITDHGGRVVKGTGDGCLATFVSARSAVAAGIAIQQELEHRGSRDAGGMRVRIGINAGEVGDRDGDMLGEAVNAAARIMAEARGGEILISRVVRDLVGTSDVVYVDRGDHILKGFPEPWRLYAVHWVSPETPVSRLQVRLLGDVFVTLDDVPLRGFESVRLQRLLARLLLRRGGGCSRTELAFELWPDSTETQARTNLRKMLHELRHALPDVERYIEIATRRLHWRPSAPADADLINFCDAIDEGRSSNAIECYGGDFLPGHYEDWIVLERERLRALAADALISVATEAESRNDHDATLTAAHQLLRLDPLREDGCRLAMRAHAGRGERAEALRAYHRCVETLHRELNVEPDAATVAVYENLRLAGGGASNGRTAESPAPGTATTSLLIGREEEWELARAMWESAAAGRASVLLVTGEPGIGKSRLVDELARFAGGTGHLVARARAYPGAGRLPWGPVIEWMRSGDLRPNTTRLSPERRAELGRLLPEHRSVPAGPPLVAGVESGGRRELFDAITAALVEGERPTMLVIDDLQWCDNDTIDAVSFILHQAPQAPLLVAATARAEEIAADHSIRALLAALVRDGRAAELRLTPLQQAATVDLAGRLLGGDVDDDAARRLWAETEGNPLFIIEALRASVGERLHKMSPTVQSVIRERLAQLSPAARSVTEVAAVVGRAFRVDVVASAMATGEDDLADALDELWSKRIIREHADGYDFTHDLLREVSHDSISPARRRKLHRAVVGSLAEVFGPELGPLSIRLAPHYEEAGLYVEAVEAYHHAADYSFEVFALDDAISLLRQALVLFEHLKPGHERDQAELSVRITLGSALAARDGYGSASVSLNYERALDLCARSLHRIEPAVLRGLGLAALVACRFDRSMRFAQALLDHREDGIAVVEGHYLMGVSQFWRGKLQESSEHLRSAIDQYQVGRASEHCVRFSQDPKAVCLVRLAFTSLWRGEPDVATSLVGEARRYAESLQHPTTLAYVLVWSGMLAVELDDRRGLREAVDSNEELCSRHPLGYFTAIARPLRGWLDVLDGRPDGVAEIAAAVDGWRVEAHAHLTYGLLLLARSHLRTGDIGAGRQAVRDGIDWGRRQDVAWAEAELRTVDGKLLIAAGDPVGAAEALCKAMAVAEEQRAGWPHGHATGALALVQTD